MGRAVILVLDSFGIGATADAAKFGDAGSDTFGHIARERAAAGKPLKLPNLAKLGLYQASRDSTGEFPAGAITDAEEALAAPNAQNAAIDALSARVDALSETARAQGRALDELSGAAGVMVGRLTGVQAPGGSAASGAAAALAYASLQEAASLGGPFPGEAATAAAYFSEDDNMAALVALAEEGAPTAAELAISFRSAARAARGAERPSGGGVVERVGRFVTGLVTVRRLDAPATDSVDDIIVRAQRALGRDDLAGAADQVRLGGGEGTGNEHGGVSGKGKGRPARGGTGPFPFDVKPVSSSRSRRAL